MHNLVRQEERVTHPFETWYIGADHIEPSFSNVLVPPGNAYGKLIIRLTSGKRITLSHTRDMDASTPPTTACRVKQRHFSGGRLHSPEAHNFNEQFGTMLLRTSNDEHDFAQIISALIRKTGTSGLSYLGEILEFQRFGTNLSGPFPASPVRIIS